jgi:class 3 adenylate cyclase
MSDVGTARGTVTVLFTDLVDSTMLRQTCGDDQADDVRREHDRLARRHAEHGGTEVSARRRLPWWCSAAGEAVGAAVAMQQAVARFSRRAPVPIGIRVGMSAGDVVWEDGDCFGTPVVEASRLCDAAADGQILVSDVVRLLAGSRGGHRFSAVGALELKGLTEPLGASEVVWESAAGAAIPALPSRLTGPGQGRFVGRVRSERPAGRLEDVRQAPGASRSSRRAGVGRCDRHLRSLPAPRTTTVRSSHGRCERTPAFPTSRSSRRGALRAARPDLTTCPAGGHLRR